MVEARELRATALTGGILFAYAAVVLSTGRVNIFEFGKLLVASVAGGVLLWVLVGTFLGFVHVGRAARASGSNPFLGEFVKGVARERWQRDRWVGLVWPPLLFAGLMASFNAFKQMVLPLAGYRFDPLLSRADRALFLGHDPWRVTHAVLGSPEATIFIDRLYHGWFLPMSLGIILCAWLPSVTFRARTQYLLTYMGVWIGIGSFLAFLLPSAGPCFYSRLVGPSPNYDALLASLAHVQSVTGSTVHSLKIQDILFADRDSHSLIIGAGISAMPSVHNALALLFALGASRLNRTAGWLFGVYAAVIWIGSIHLGWHYAVDGLVADALTFGLWRVSGRVAERLERPFASTYAEPALA
ncbi:PAP2 superfamily protein [Sphingomonas sp. F9_3S_D5_B_2]